MTFTFVVVISLLSLMAWIGQLLSAVAPQLAVRLGLMEPAKEVDPVFLLDVKAECIWDALTLWTLPVATLLFFVDNPLWALVGLIGGAMYLYFAGRGLLQRRLMRRSAVAVGSPSTVRLFTLFLILWGAAGTVQIILSGFELIGRS